MVDGQQNTHFLSRSFSVNLIAKWQMKLTVGFGGFGGGGRGGRGGRGFLQFLRLLLEFDCTIEGNKFYCYFHASCKIHLLIFFSFV